MPRIKSVNFGISPEQQYDDGTQSSIAINAHNQCVEVHRGESDEERNLYFRVAAVSGDSLNFTDAKPGSYATGNNPAVALTDSNTVIEAHDRDGKLYYSVRTTSTQSLSKSTETEYPNQDASSSDPSLAVNAGGTLVSVHVSNANQLRWRLGQITSGVLTWQERSTAFTADGSSANDVNGDLPSVSINDSGRAVVVYRRGTRLFYRTGQYVAATSTTGASIIWQSPHDYDDGTDPSVAITSDNWVFEAHKASPLDNLYQRVGRISNDGETIEWQTYLGGNTPSYLFDMGVRPRVATNDKVAVHVQQSETRKALFGTACLVFDRGSWISDNFTSLREKTLRELVLPGSHDAAQYRESIGLQTQTLDIFGQLSAGVRWFDLRLAVDGGKIKVHHSIVIGVDFQDVLDDVRRFMKDHNELVILKISHFLGFDQNVDDTAAIDKTIEMIRDKDSGLREWLVTRDLEKRLGRTELRELIGAGTGAVLIVMDNKDDDDKVQTYLDYDRSKPKNKGIRNYRDWYASDPQKGDLTVFDIYSHTASFETMATGTGNDPDSTNARTRPTADKKNGDRLPVGQFPKFALFDGICRLQDPAENDVPCDLFLLSWTLTVDGSSPVTLSRDANKRLVEYSAARPGANGHQRIINLLYTDVSQSSRSADVAMIRNGLR